MTLTFSLQRAVLMFRYVDANVRTEIQYNYFNQDFHFGQQNKDFVLAFGISSFYESTRDASPEDYGNIEAIYESWNATDNPTTPVPYRPCKPIDFGLDESEATEKQFFDVSEAKKPEVSRVLHRLNCIDQMLDLYGDWNSGSA